METPEPIRGMGTAHIQDTAISILYAIEFFLTSRQSQSFSGGPFMDSHWSFVCILMWLEFPMVVHLWITVGDSLSLIYCTTNNGYRHNKTKV